MSASARSLTLILFCLVVLAGCGDGGNDNQAPEVTAEPTLTTEERASFSPGSAENPLRLMVHPVKRVMTETQTILAELSGTPAETITAETTLRVDLGLPENLNTLSASLSEGFGVNVPSPELTQLQTVGDLADRIEVALAEQVAQALFERTSIYFEVVPVASYGEGLNAVCNSNQGVVSMAWLDGITTLAATQGGCGDASLRVATLGGAYNVGFIEDIELMPEVEQTPEVELTAEATPEESDAVMPTATPTETPTPEPTPLPTEEVELTPEATAEFEENSLESGLRFGTPVFALFNSDLGTTSFDVIRGRTLCRVGYDDFYTWLVPTMMMRRNNIDPQEIATIADYDNEAQLVRAVADGRCTATVISEDTYETLVEIIPQEIWDEIRFGEISPIFPYATLVYSADIQQGVRLTLNEVFGDLSTDDIAGDALRWLLGQDVVVAFEEGDLSAFTAYVESTGLDLAQLGN